MRQLQQDLRHVDDRGGHSAGGRQLQVVQRRLHVRLLLREAADLVVLGEFEVNLPMIKKIILFIIELFGTTSLSLYPFPLKSDQVQISPAASPQIKHHTVGRTRPFIA